MDDHPYLLESLPALGVFGGLTISVAFVIAGTIWGAAAAAWRGRFTDRGTVFALIFALAFVGGVVGFATGLSRVGVVGNVVPAVLALFGGMSAYLFGVDRSKGLVASFGVLAFSAAFFVQLTVGTQQRVPQETKELLINACLATYSGSNWTQEDFEFKQERLNCPEIEMKLRGPVQSFGGKFNG